MHVAIYVVGHPTAAVSRCGKCNECMYLRVGTYAPVSEPVHVTPWLGGGYPREFQPGLLMRREKPISVRYLPWLIWMTHSFRLLTPMHRTHKNNDLARDSGSLGFLWKLQETLSHLVVLTSTWPLMQLCFKS